jgi:hypothetical protein
MRKKGGYEQKLVLPLKAGKFKKVDFLIISRKESNLIISFILVQ